MGDIVYPAPHPRFIPSKNPPPVGDDVTGIFELVADVDAGAIKDLRETIRDRDYGMDFEIHVPDKCIPVPA